jgi:putative addiction module killer protein
LNQIEIREYVTAQGRNLYRHWMDRLDQPVQKRVDARIRRMSAGNFGKGRHLGAGLYEAILDFGPGYRVYYGYHGNKVVILLCGGDKSMQDKDIKAAMAHWQDCQQGGLR